MSRTYTSDELQTAKKLLLTEVLAKAESLKTAQEVRHLIKDYIIHESVYLTDKKPTLVI